MKLTVFGSTGKVGRNVVTQALAQGHEVTAFARNPDKVGTAHKNLKVVVGNVLDPDAVAQALEGSEAVVCALGMPLMNKEKLRARGTEIIVAEMEKRGLKRLVCLSGLGIGDSRDILPFHYKYLIMPLMLRYVYADHAIQEGHVRRSDLDWVLVRPGNFSKGEHTGAYRHGFTASDPSPALKISFPDVADFMLRQVANDTYLHQAPCLSY